MEESNNNFINTNNIINQGNKNNNIKSNINMMKIKAALYLKKVNENNKINNNIFLEDKNVEKEKEKKEIEKEKEKNNNNNIIIENDPLENYLNDIEKDAVFQLSDLLGMNLGDNNAAVEKLKDQLIT